MLKSQILEQLHKKHIDGPLGVRGRNSDNRLIQEKLGWKPTLPLKTGLKDLYLWIDGLIKCNCDEDITCIQHRPDYNYDDPYFDKPLKSLSAYKKHDLISMATKMNIQTEGKNKTDLYNNINDLMKIEYII